MIDRKVVAVTGAGSGIGRATALAFAHEGHAVVVADRTAEQGKAVAAECSAAAPIADFTAFDVSDEESVE